MTGRARSPVEYGGCSDEKDEESFEMWYEKEGPQLDDSIALRDYEKVVLTATVDWKEAHARVKRTQLPSGVSCDNSKLVEALQRTPLVWRKRYLTWNAINIPEGLA